MKVCTGKPQYDINKWIKHYIAFLEREEMAINTMATYERVLHSLSLFVAKANLNSIKEIDTLFIQDFIIDLERQYKQRMDRVDVRFTETTKRLYIVILKLMFDYIDENAEIDADGTMYSFANEFSSLTKRKRGRKARAKNKSVKYLYSEEVTNLLDYLDRKIEERGGHYDYIYSLAVRLMLFGGLRVSEALSLKKKDIVVSQEMVELHLVNTKSGTDQFVPVKLAHLEKEISYIFSLGDNRDEYLVADRALVKPLDRSNLYRRVNSIYGNAGIKEKKGLHILRHTSAMMLLEKTSDITLVQQLLRHSNISTTSIYTHRDMKQLSRKIV